MVVRLSHVLLFAVVQYAAVNADVLSYKLNDGYKIPAIALGTSLGHLPDGTRVLSVNHSLAQAVQWALEAGYRHVDTAALYRTEHEVGLGVRDFLRDNSAVRSDLYITTKVGDNYSHKLKYAVVQASSLIIHCYTSSAIIVDVSPFDYSYTHRQSTQRGTFSELNTTHIRLLVIPGIPFQLWNDAHERHQVIPALTTSLEQLQMTYVDLYLMHYPMAYHKNGSISGTDYLETWKGMQDAQLSGSVKSIGVSNFNLTQMQRLWDNSRIKPAVLQIEVNPTLTQSELVDWCKKRGVVVMAYTPFGAILGRKSDAPPPRADHPFLMRIANKYNKTVPQILLRYLLDRQLVAIPRSTNKERIQQNINILDFSLAPAEVRELSQFNSNYRLRTAAKWYFHPEFPFEKKNLTDSEVQYIINHSRED